jgi:hypothetical protein
MSQSQPSSVIQSLETVRDKVKLRLMKLPEYRALLAIEQPMAEVADIPDLVAHLQTGKQKILERLATTQEYQALLTVEKAIKDISEILDVVGNDGNFDGAPAASEKVVGEEEVSAIKTAAAAEMQQSGPAIAATAPGDHRERSLSNPTARLSTLGLVEEWRLTALVHEPQSTVEGKAEAEEAKVA